MEFSTWSISKYCRCDIRSSTRLGYATHHLISPLGRWYWCCESLRRVEFDTWSIAIYCGDIRSSTRLGYVTRHLISLLELRWYLWCCVGWGSISSIYCRGDIRNSTRSGFATHHLISPLWKGGTGVGVVGFSTWDCRPMYEEQTKFKGYSL